MQEQKRTSFNLEIFNKWDQFCWRKTESRQLLLKFNVLNSSTNNKQLTYSKTHRHFPVIRNLHPQYRNFRYFTWFHILISDKKTRKNHQLLKLNGDRYSALHAISNNLLLPSNTITIAGSCEKNWSKWILNPS